MRYQTPLLALLAALVVGACATPEALRGDYPEVTPRDAGAGAASETAAQSPGRVRWGGMILSLKNEQDRTCFEVLGKALNRNARPTLGDSNVGRFLACTDQYKDPAEFEPGRDITIVGSVDGAETRNVGDYAYRYPKVEAETLYLWPEQDAARTYYYAYDPFPYPYAYYYPQAYYAYPVVYVVPPDAPEPPQEPMTPEQLASFNVRIGGAVQPGTLTMDQRQPVRSTLGTVGQGLGNATSGLLGGGR